jgi:glycosyltransferase involved in cell wall biosynthesis
MFGELTVAVVMPAFNEERAIERAVATIPSFVDRVIVVDDASRDATALAAAGAGAAAMRGDGIEVIRHPENRGVGAAIISGYRRALALGIDVAVVMAGDGQMDPSDLEALLAPLAEGRADYVKGNRFKDREVWRAMPRARIVGNVLLSMATKLSSGYWRVFDSQCGYTAISRRALESVDLDRLFPRYGYPNDLLARLHRARMRVIDVPVQAVYGPHWKSGITIRTAIYPVAFVLARSCVWRIGAEMQGRLRRALPASTPARPGAAADAAGAAAPRSEASDAAADSLG